MIYRGGGGHTPAPAAFKGDTVSTTVNAPPGFAPSGSRTPRTDGKRRKSRSMYPRWLLIPSAVLFIPLFLVPTAASFFFSFTRWNLSSFELIGFDNYVTFFSEPALVLGLRNTFVFAAVTTALKVILGLLFAVFLTSAIRGTSVYRAIVFFPVIVSTIGVGFTFGALMRPDGVINSALALFGIAGPDWLGDPNVALLSVALVEVWKGVGFSAVIFIAGIVSIPAELYEAATVDGANAWSRFWDLTLPLVRPAMVTVMILSVIQGLRSFEMVWAMTQGGPAGRSDVIASLIYKQFAGGFYGLATAGNVVLFLIVAAVAVPLSYFLTRRETQL